MPHTPGLRAGLGFSLHRRSTDDLEGAPSFVFCAKGGLLPSNAGVHLFSGFVFCGFCRERLLRRSANTNAWLLSKSRYLVGTLGGPEFRFSMVKCHPFVLPLASSSSRTSLLLHSPP